MGVTAIETSQQYLEQQTGPSACEVVNAKKLLGADINENDEDATYSDCEAEFPDDDREKHSTDDAPEDEPIKCSAVHTLERDMPDFDYSHLVDELRMKILEECEFNEGIYSEKDIEKCKTNDWHIARFLLRQKLDVELAFDMMKKTMRFHHESLCNFIRPEDFPAEFYKIGGLFMYEPDRKGNLMLYVRGKIHKKIHELNAIVQAFLYYNIHGIDELAGGKGISIVLDCSGAGISNADMDMIMFLLQMLMNYFPKGMSYLLVHELPWVLKPFWLIAKAWIPEEHRQLVKFSNSRTIYEYVDKKNLPDFMGGCCERNYRQPPENCTTLKEAAKLWGIEAEVAKRILMKFADHLPPESIDQLTELNDVEPAAEAADQTLPIEA